MQCQSRRCDVEGGGSGGLQDEEEDEGKEECSSSH